jgi:hypothetical protein
MVHTIQKEMKVRVKHKDTEVEVNDEGVKQDTYGLIYYNQNYLLNLLQKIADEIVKMNKEHE